MSPLKRTFWLGAGLIVLSNAVALGGVYYNRSGAPDSVLQLSERELAVSYSQFMDGSDYDSQVLKLQINVADGWVTAEKLTALGFSVGVNDSEYHDNGEGREGLVVLEMQGAAYNAEIAAAQASVAEAERALAQTPEVEAIQKELSGAQADVARLLTSSSRLFVVDAGLDEASLRERYPDRSRYAVARAHLRFGIRYSRSDVLPKKYSLYPHLSEVSVPSQWSAVFKGWKYYDRDAEDRSKTRIELAFGKRFEPWMIAAQKVD